MSDPPQQHDAARDVDERLDRISARADVERGRSWTGTPALTGVLAVLVVAAVAALGFGVHRARHPADGAAPDGELTATTARMDAVAAASRGARLATTYSWRTFDADVARAEAQMTAGFRAQYAATMSSSRAHTVSGRATVRASVPSAGVRSLTTRHATVLVFLDQVTTAQGRANQRLERSRVLVDLIRQDGRWRVSGIEAR